MFNDTEETPDVDSNIEIRESERRLIQKELFLLEDQKDAAEQRFRLMFENALVGLFRGSVATGKLTDANLEAARIFGFDNVDELIWWVNVESEAFSSFRSIPDPELLDAGEPYSFSSHTQRRDGSDFWAQYSVRYTEEGRYLEGAVKDITDQVVSMERLRQAKAEAEDASEAKSRFLATISHEIRTPLNGIIGFAEILQERNDLKSREYSRKILDESDRLMILINQLLDFSKLEANKITLETILLDLHQLLNEIETSFRKTIIRSGLAYTREMDPEIPRCFIGDPMRLRQILTNLLSNALKFTQEGSIILRITGEGEIDGVPLIHFSVIDTGIGIPIEKQEAIFASFEQADSSISRRYGGTGLGISICRELVGLMGGVLLLESRIGEGSMFHFTIPLPKAPENPDAVPTYRDDRLSRVGTLSGIRVLIVEDYETNREIAQHHLEKAGCRVFHAENGLEALHCLRGEEQIDLIFMDMHMPLMDGLETTRRLRAEGFGTPVIGMTASAYAEDRVRCLDAGMDDFVTKPLRRADLLARAVDWVKAGELAAGSNPGIPETGTAMTGSSTLRYNDFLVELDGESDLAHELLDGFVEDTRYRLDRCDTVMTAGEMELLHREVHSIKGGALNVMADELAGFALELESLARNKSSGEEIDQALDALKGAFGRFIEAWKNIKELDETVKRQPGTL